MGSVVKALKYVAMRLVWLVQLLTQAKSFEANPIMGSPWLNRLGLYNLRVIVSHAIMRFRQLLLSPLMPAKLRKQFHQQGYVIIEDFFEPSIYEALLKEVAEYQGEARQCIQGDTRTQHVFLTQACLQDLPACKQALSDSRWNNYLKYCAGSIEKPRSYIQRIINQIPSNAAQTSAADPQKVLHMDTFHPTMKAWLFLQDVTPEQGPFTYVPGSNRLSKKLLQWLHKQSVEINKNDNRYAKKGSLRALASDMPSLDLPQPKSFAVKQNTLVIANTFGFHRRGDVTQDNSSRLELWSSSRTNPFNPIPGLPFVSKLREIALEELQQIDDVTAKNNNARASWHKILIDRFK